MVTVTDEGGEQRLGNHWVYFENVIMTYGVLTVKTHGDITDR